MAFRYSEIGQQVATNPKQAHAKLAALFVRHRYNRKAVAEHLGVNLATLQRWLRRLEEQGLADPRGGRRATMGRRPKH